MNEMYRLSFFCFLKCPFFFFSFFQYGRPTTHMVYTVRGLFTILFSGRKPVWPRSIRTPQITPKDVRVESCRSHRSLLWTSLAPPLSRMKNDLSHRRGPTDDLQTL